MMVNSELETVLALLERVATITPEFPADAVDAEIEEGFAELVSKHPQLERFPDYLDFLRSTGGAHVNNDDFSLGVYGFGGYLVTSFEEGNFLDQERYFQFGEVLYHAEPEPNYMLAFDLQAAGGAVFLTPIEESTYVRCADSFVALLRSFAEGKYPALPHEP